MTFGYFEYIIGVEDGLDREADPINGGKPLGVEGLKSWIAHSPEFNLDKARVAAMGGSAGAGTSLWLAFHDDLADPASPDPVLREFLEAAP